MSIYNTWICCQTRRRRRYQQLNDLTRCISIQATIRGSSLFWPSVVAAHKDTITQLSEPTIRISENLSER